MTNREWLESLSDEKLAKFIYEIVHTLCSCCAYSGNDNMCNANQCLIGREQWLKVEHEK